jgi:hypothetical protein
MGKKFYIHIAAEMILIKDLKSPDGEICKQPQIPEGMILI